MSTQMPPEIIWINGAFRQAEDCSTEIRLNDWFDGHHWSVRLIETCVDEPYASGKFEPADFPVEELTPLPIATTPYMSPPLFHREREAEVGLLSTPAWPEITHTHINHPPQTEPLAPIPLPLSAALLLPALIILAIMRKVK